MAEAAEAFGGISAYSMPGATEGLVVLTDGADVLHQCLRSKAGPAAAAECGSQPGGVFPQDAAKNRGVHG